MKPEEFENIWTRTGDTLSSFTQNTLVGLDLKPKTIEFLTKAGLPQDAAPFLTFANNSVDKFQGIVRLTDQFNFLDGNFKKWIVIGACGDGSPIVINVERDDQIEWLDHDHNFESFLINRSLEALADCLVIYRDFIQNIQEENGEDAYLDGNFSDAHFESLKNKLLVVDSRAFSEKAFWKEQLDQDLARRDDRKNGQ